MNVVSHTGSNINGSMDQQQHCLQGLKHLWTSYLSQQLPCCVHAAVIFWRLSDAAVALKQECPPLLDCLALCVTASK